MNEKYGVYFGGVIKREKAVGKIEKHIEKIDDGDFKLGLIKSIDILRGVEAENIEHKLQNAKETTWVTDGIPKWKVWLIVKIARLKAKARWCWMTKQEVIKLSIEQIAKEVCESCYGSDEPKGKCEKCGYNVAISALKTAQAMRERNITVEMCEEYMKFEDECVKKGFSFKSLLEAREKQEAKKPIDKGTTHKSLRCPICNCEVEFNRGIIQLGYCEYCGQKIDWSNGRMSETFSNVISTIKELSEKQKWIPCSERMPNVEEKVLAKCIRKYIDGTTKPIITTAMYEDGNFLDCDSMWNWEEIDWAGWDDENDCGIIPKGWYEYHEYNPDGVLNYAIDDEVVAWMELHEPYQADENKIDENRVCAAKQMGFLK